MGLLFCVIVFFPRKPAERIPFQDAFVKHVGGNYIDSLE